MKDYSHLGLNSKLQAKSSLANKTRFQDAYSFDAGTDNNLITNYKVQNLSFNKLTGGTITLSEGLSIQNEAGTTILDSLGLNSSNNFDSVYLSSNANGTVVGTSPSSLGTVGTISTTRTLKVFLYLNTLIADAETVLTGDEPSASAFMYISAGTIDNIPFVYGQGERIPYTGGYATTYDFISAGRLYSLSAGTYPIVVKLKSDEATGTAITAGFNAGYFILGQ